VGGLGLNVIKIDLTSCGLDLSGSMDRSLNDIIEIRLRSVTCYF